MFSHSTNTVWTLTCTRSHRVLWFKSVWWESRLEMGGKMAPSVATSGEGEISLKDHSECKGPAVEVNFLCSGKRVKGSWNTRSTVVFVGKTLKPAFYKQQACQQDFAIRTAHRQGRSSYDSGMSLLRRMPGMLSLSGLALPVLSNETRLSSCTSQSSTNPEEAIWQNVQRTFKMPRPFDLVNPRRGVQPKVLITDIEEALSHDRARTSMIHEDKKELINSIFSHTGKMNKLECVSWIWH